jgi:hypothetical protein
MELDKKASSVTTRTFNVYHSRDGISVLSIQNTPLLFIFLPLSSFLILHSSFHSL